jgi:hypothetical protein
MKLMKKLWAHWLLSLLALVVLAACAVRPEVVDHAFSFDVRRDSQDDVEVLNYRYGNSKLPVRASETRVRDGETFGFQGVHGPMLRGEFLYVKWRLKSTGQVYEDNVDLRQRLPDDIKDHRVHFIIHGAQLYIYLITPERRTKDEPAIGPEMYRYRKTILIYPDQSKP